MVIPESNDDKGQRISNLPKYYKDSCDKISKVEVYQKDIVI